MARRAIVIIWTCLLSAQIVMGQIPQLVDYDTDSIVDVKTAQEKWLFAEARMKVLVNQAVKMFLPKLMELTSTLNISTTCMKNGLQLIGGIKKLKAWAFKFVDASSKSIDGTMGGTLASFGAFEECLDNKVVNQKSGKQGEILFQGKYCRVHVRPYLPPKPLVLRFTDRLEALKNVFDDDTVIDSMTNRAHYLYSSSLSFGLCVPSGCSKHDVNQLLQEAGNFLGVVIKTKRCEIREEKKYTPVIIGVMSVYSFIGSLVLIASLVDIYCHYSQPEKISMDESRSIKFLCCFSLLTSFRKFTDTSASSGTFTCLHGIRTLTMGWIILGHTYFIASLTPQSLPTYFEKVIQEFSFQAILNGTLSVDTFFFIGGMVLCYSATKSFKIGKKPFSFIMYVSHRLWRLLPTYSIVISFAFLGPILGSGPTFHEIVDPIVSMCERNWWTSILFINNFYDSENMCMAQGWYLTLDMQFYLGALIIILPLMRWPKLGTSVAVSIILACMLGSALQMHVADMMHAPLIVPDAVSTVKYFRDYYVMPHCHAGSYCIGLLCGYLLAMHPKIKIPKVVQLCGWCLTIVVSLCVVNGIQRWQMGVIPTFWEKALYLSCSRIAWTLAVAWVVVSCSTGHGGIANHVLSWKVWIPLGRLSFLAYLLNPLVMIYYSVNMQTVFHIEHITVVWLFFGHLCITYIAAFGVSMLVEAPFLSLEKMIFPKEKDELLSGASKNMNHIASPIRNGAHTVLNVKDLVSEERNGTANSTFLSRL